MPKRYTFKPSNIGFAIGLEERVSDSIKSLVASIEIGPIQISNEEHPYIVYVKGKPISEPLGKVYVEELAEPSTEGMTLTAAQYERLAFLLEACGAVIQEAATISHHGFGHKWFDETDTARKRMASVVGKLRAALKLMRKTGDIEELQEVAELSLMWEELLGRAKHQPEDIW